jgi:uncharacterized protein YjbI with pentapeptide repeats
VGTGPDFSWACGANMNLNGANFETARMVGTDLSFATMVRANLRFIDFTSARLFGANLCGMSASPIGRI